MRTSKILAVILVVLLFGGLSIYSRAQSAEQILQLYEELKWRSIGPAVMGGRTVDLDVVEKQPWIIYAAIGPSGVWKTENNGITWMPVFTNESSVSVGDVTIAQSHPDIVWVGTGEATCRNSVTIGDGVYKSVDAGKTWKNMGLENTRHISRIVINPGDPNIVYVAAMGHLWGPNKERGIYKTTDGGQTWAKTLYVDENTGFADLAMDPSDSLTLYAAAYEYRRLPYHFTSGGKGSGIYKTSDGGKTWNKLEKDLPEGIMGRIGLAVSRSRPHVVYALIEHKEGGIWRSEDRGETWERTSDTETTRTVNNRPFYYSQIRVDPTDDGVIYVFSSGGYVSRDKGKKFRPISGGTHSDHHALWIDPSNPLHLIDGNDGGIDITYDGGKNWLPIRHMALAEVYQIGFDMRDPYFVYCGLQDNGLWGGPSRTLESSGIFNEDWYVVGGGDGFHSQVDPTDPTTIYGNSQVNGLYRYDLRIGRRKPIKPLASLNDPPYRYNWNSPILISPHDPSTVYTGGNFLFKTTDRGHTWTVISPDLTTDDPKKQQDSGGPISMENTGAESHCTIITIAESPVQKGVIWCGTDDGNVQVTQNSGETWTNVVKNIPDLPPHTWCSRIEASHFDAGTAYAAFDGHRHDDYATYVYKTTDYGKSWISIKGNLPFGWVHVVREDLKNKNLLFVGTEFGIHASLDAGKSWFSLKNKLPTASVRDIAIHPRANDLIIGTHGQGVWILDDITPLQEMTEDVLQAEKHLFSIRPETQFYHRNSRESFGRPEFRGQNPFYGVFVTAYFKEKPEAKPKIFIKDENGEKVYEIPLRKEKGLQRKTWNMRTIAKNKEGKEIKPGAGGFAGYLNAQPGRYTAELLVGDKTLTENITVYPDPRVDVNEKIWLTQKEHFVEALILSKKMGLTVTVAKNIRRQLDKIKAQFEENESQPDKIKDALQSFEKKMKDLEDDVVPKGIGLRSTREESLRGGSVARRITSLVMNLGGFPFPPTSTDLLQLKELEDVMESYVERANTIIEEDIPALNTILEMHSLKPIKPPKKVELKL
ncbi:MAG: hypothetical protein PVI66_11945 [Candidatus Aminicenantes bacterium]|jgi:hypothetical protein